MGRPRITLENANSTTKIYHLFEFDATINIVTIVTAYFIVLRSVASVNVIITDGAAAVAVVVDVRRGMSLFVMCYECARFSTAHTHTNNHIIRIKFYDFNFAVCVAPHPHSHSRQLHFSQLVFHSFILILFSFSKVNSWLTTFKYMFQTIIVSHYTVINTFESLTQNQYLSTKNSILISERGKKQQQRRQRKKSAPFHFVLEGKSWASKGKKWQKQNGYENMREWMR